MVQSEIFHRGCVKWWTVKGARSDLEGTCFGGSILTPVFIFSVLVRMHLLGDMHTNATGVMHARTHSSDVCQDRSLRHVLSHAIPHGEWVA